MSVENKKVNIEKVNGNVLIDVSAEYRVGSAINELLKIISSNQISFERINRKPSPQTIVKIDHNNLRGRSSIIREYLIYSSTIENAYDEIDRIVPFGKNIILRSLNSLYFQALDRFDIDHILGDIDIEKIRDHSEQIIDFIIDKLKDTIYKSANTPELSEYINTGVNVTVAHAFIECVIMENPNDP